MLFIGFIENSIQAGMLVVILLIVTFLLRRASKSYSYLLWMLLFLRLLVPVQISAPAGILPEISLENILGGGTSAEENAGKQVQLTQKDSSENTDEAVQTNKMTGGADGRADKTETGNNGSQSNDNAENTDRKKLVNSSEKQSDTEGRDQTDAVQDSSEMADKSGMENVSGEKKGTVLLSILFVVWIAGAAVMGCHAVWSAVRLQRLLRTSVRCELFGMKNVYQSDKISVPMVNGIVRPKIYLPLLALEPYQQQYILEHEQMHIRRRDFLVKAVCYCLLCLNWFNPTVWAAFGQLERSMEFSCDEAVVARLGNSEKKAYSRTLLMVAAGKLQREERGAFALGFSEKNTKNRIKNVMEYESRARWVTVAVSMLLIGCFVCFLGGRGSFVRSGGSRDTDVARSEKSDAQSGRSDGQEENEKPPAIVVDQDGNIIGTYRGEKLERVMLMYYNDIKNGVSDFSIRNKECRIESRAFSDCINMKRLVVMNTSSRFSYVADDAFEGCPSDLVVYCDKGTYLWKRLNELGIACEDNPENRDLAVMLSGEKRAKEIEEKAFSKLSEEIKKNMINDGGELVMSVEAKQNLTAEELQEYEGTSFYIMTDQGRIIETQGAVHSEARASDACTEFPPEAKILGDSLFKDNAEMTEVKIHAGIEEIGITFDGSSLKKVGFADKDSHLKKIGVGAFSMCNFCDSPKLVIPEGVTELGASAFMSCDGLQEIVLPKSLKKIGIDCFSGCLSLKKVTIKSSDTVFDESDAYRDGDIFRFCGSEYIEEKNDFTDPTVVIHAPEGSTAQKYAEKYGHHFEALE